MMRDLAKSGRPDPVASVPPARTTALHDNGSSTAKELNEAPAGEAQSNEAPAGEAQSNEAPAGEAQSNEAPAGEATKQRSPGRRGPKHEAPAGEAQLHVASPAGGGAPRRYRRIAMGLALSDALCVVVALLASYALRYPGELVSAP